MSDDFGGGFPGGDDPDEPYDEFEDEPGGDDGPDYYHTYSVLEHTPGYEYLDYDDQIRASELFEAGFGHGSGGFGLDYARDELYNLLQIDESQFPWDEWREWYE